VTEQPTYESGQPSWEESQKSQLGGNERFGRSIIWIIEELKSIRQEVYSEQHRNYDLRE